ncbi:Winged helix DNA-binding domain-containing protein [Amycolatopsis arida]|uniref:Winged helix DNA-binding domain-containing protein n=1 Tax=Amycolatopsis arida TaxID=587909 RepID=A0A1I5XN08_9PSEU|nr:transcriptional regulator [Amycolatopsis arida]TDX97351.1 winged helix DNA-binding protein [Amycolatopsis arida]SFQ33338.1 Winged helix DNA-binding domain-containing protein [Amycolatopsis arida]
MSEHEAPHPALALDETTHQRVRLAILAVLAEATECTFAALRDQLELTDGNLSRHLRVLEEAGLVELRKTFAERRPRTYLRLTRAGRAALRAQLDAMEQLVHRLRDRTDD